MTLITFYKKYPFLAILMASSIIFGFIMVGKKLIPEKQDEITKKVKLDKKTSFHGNMQVPIDEGEFSHFEKNHPQRISGDGEIIESTVPFIQKVKTLEKVEDHYLDGALFIGDSRTTILHDYAKWDKTDFFVKNGLTVWSVQEEVLDTVGGQKQTLGQVLKAKSYPKIYIMLGINELGTGTPDKFAQQYATVIDNIIKDQPESIIFLQEIVHVTSQKDAEGSYINNNEVNRRNDALRKICNGKQVIYLDINDIFDLEGTGTLNPSLSGDGVHIQAKNIQLWKQYLLNNGVRLPKQ